MTEMTEIEKQLARVDISRFPIPMRLHAEMSPEGSLFLIVERDVQDVDVLLGDSPIPAYGIECFAKAHVPHVMSDFPAFAYSALKAAVLHELAEHFTVDGIKVHDPHKNDKK